MSEFEAKAQEIIDLWMPGDFKRFAALGEDRYLRAAITTALAEADANAYERGRREDDFANCERIAELEKALAPFEAIKPSSLHPADGSENEPYIVVLKDCNGNPVAFTGGDLANARVVLSQGDRTAEDHTEAGA